MRHGHHDSSTKPQFCKDGVDEAVRLGSERCGRRDEQVIKRCVFLPARPRMCAVSTPGDARELFLRQILAVERARNRGLASKLQVNVATLKRDDPILW